MEIVLEKMTIEEKLRLMDKIWNMLLPEEETLPSPEWHREVLEKREYDFREGREKVYDWQYAKKHILSSVHEDQDS